MAQFVDRSIVYAAFNTGLQEMSSHGVTIGTRRQQDRQQMVG